VVAEQTVLTAFHAQVLAFSSFGLSALAAGSALSYKYAARQNDNVGIVGRRKRAGTPPTGPMNYLPSSALG
jgi:hypothetical protein